MPSLAARIEREVGSWDGVTVSPHRYGGIEFRVGRRELGHLHRSEEHTSQLQSLEDLVCRLLLEKKK